MQRIKFIIERFSLLGEFISEVPLYYITHDTLQSRQSPLRIPTELGGQLNRHDSDIDKPEITLCRALSLSTSPCVFGPPYCGSGRAG